MFISAKIKGSSMRQKVTIAAQSMGAHFSETNISKPPRKPQIRTEGNVEIPPDIEEITRMIEETENIDRDDEDD
jgi:hypothetical protein